MMMGDAEMLLLLLLHTLGMNCLLMRISRL